MPSVHIDLGTRSYDIVLSSAGLEDFVKQVASKSTTAFVVLDSNVQIFAAPIIDQLRGSVLSIVEAVVPAGETSKSLSCATELYDQLADAHADRHCLVVALGGGVVGDLAGFVAATYNRGLPLLMIPTTLLAMVDSSIGGKVAINHPKGKNLIGAFHQPVGVWINRDFLKTLPVREYRSGLAEVVKYGVILDADFFSDLERHSIGLINRDAELLERVISTCCQLKAKIVEQDEREETGLRAVLNYGHTFAHAFETVGGYSGWLHGEAVAAGMVCASRLASRLGCISPEITERQIRLLTALGLPIKPLPSWPLNALIDAMYHDKKAVAGRLRFVLPTRIGHVELVANIPESLVREVLQQ